MHPGFFSQRFLITRRHPQRGEDDDRSRFGGIGLEDFQRRVDPPFIRDDYAQRIRALSARTSLLAQLWIGQAESDVVVPERAVPDKHGVAKRALAEQMRLVFARCEIDRRKILGRDLAVDRHRERDRDERSSVAALLWGASG